MLSYEVWSILKVDKFKTVLFFESLANSKVFMNFFENNAPSLVPIVSSSQINTNPEIENLLIFDEIMCKELFEKLSLDILQELPLRNLTTVNYSFLTKLWRRVVEDEVEKEFDQLDIFHKLFLPDFSHQPVNPKLKEGLKLYCKFPLMKLEVDKLISFAKFYQEPTLARFVANKDSVYTKVCGF